MRFTTKQKIWAIIKRKGNQLRQTNRQPWFYTKQIRNLKIIVMKNLKHLVARWIKYIENFSRETNCSSELNENSRTENSRKF